jgi:cell wall assembly regulator SMI1
MSTLIERLDKWLAENRSEYYQKLNPGANDEDMAELEEIIDAPLPDDLKSFLKWRNGQDGRNFKSLYYNYMLMDTEEIAESVEINNSMLENEEFDKANWWNTQWIPFLQNGAGDYYCIDLAGSFGGTKGQVIEYNHDYEGRDIQHPSFDAWLQTLVEGCEQGLLEYDDTGMQPNSDEFDTLFNRINPGYPISHEAG